LYINRKYTHAFTLIEMMGTAFILLVLSALAAPSFYGFIQVNQSAGIQSEFIAALAFARSEAAKRGIPVILKATSSLGGGNEWGGGWQIGVDVDSSGTLDSGETILKTKALLPSGVKLGGGEVSSVVFTGRGYLLNPVNVEIMLCKVGQTSAGIKIIVLPNGMSDVIENVTCSA
jgi:Tfp pilus assembly protein FimT